MDDFKEIINFVFFIIICIVGIISFMYIIDLDKDVRALFYFDSDIHICGGRYSEFNLISKNPNFYKNGIEWDCFIEKDDGNYVHKCCEADTWRKKTFCETCLETTKFGEQCLDRCECDWWGYNSSICYEYEGDYLSTEDVDCYSNYQNNSVMLKICVFGKYKINELYTDCETNNKICKEIHKKQIKK